MSRDGSTVGPEDGVALGCCERVGVLDEGLALGPGLMEGLLVGFS